MRKIFFCARALGDYLSKVKNIGKLKLPPDPLSLPPVQKILGSLSTGSDDGEIFLSTGIDGLRLDFNSGLRLDVPKGSFRVVISDFDSGLILFDRELSDVRLVSVEKYFIRWQVEVFSGGAKIFEHVLNLEGQTVRVVFDKAAGLGDTLANLPAAQAAANFHKCRVVITVPTYLADLAANLYPELEQVATAPAETYATFYPVMNYGDFPTVPADTRSAPLERMAGVILGLNAVAPKPTFKPTAAPVTRDPYVCIAVQASSATKGWHYPGGWAVVVDYLKSLGYRVLCIDKKNFRRDGDYTCALPDGAEDFTGDRPIMERANMLYHADFFIGLSSGLAWLADVVNCPVVMICGFSHDWHEFYTPYRAANRLVCNGCYSDVRVRAVDNFCPYHKGTPRELECQKKISPRQVLNAVERLIVDKGLTPPKILS